MNLEPAYRVATAADHALVVAMLSELIDELGPPDNAAMVKGRLADDVRLALESATVRIFLADVADAAVGLSRADILDGDPIFRLRPDNRCGYVDQMFVRPGYRGRRIGAELLRLCEVWFREQHLKHCVLHAAPKAVRFYSRKGYQPNREMFKAL